MACATAPALHCPTGTISLAFADNASNGIEPPFSYTYQRRKRMDDGSYKQYTVEDYAWRLFKHSGGDTDNLPDSFVTALEISASAHKNMVAAVALSRHLFQNGGTDRRPPLRRFQRPLP